MAHIRLLRFVLFLAVLAGMLNFAHAQVVVNNASLTWKAGLSSAAFTDISPRIVLEYGTLIYETDLDISDDLLLELEKLGPRRVSQSSMRRSSATSGWPHCTAASATSTTTANATFSTTRFSFRSGATPPATPPASSANAT